MKIEDATTGGLSLLGASVGFTDGVKNWLDIILIVLSIINISIILIIKLRKYLKDGKLDDEEKKDISEDLKTIHKEIDKLKKEDGDDNE